MVQLTNISDKENVNMSGKNIGDASSKLPLSRVKTIMKSSPNVDSIGAEVIFTVSKCTEIFLQFMSLGGLKRCNSQKLLDYKGIAELVNTDDKLNFLSEVLPRKMTFREAKKLLQTPDDDDASESSDEA
ncbi:Histone-like transcription factor (CBF/NF-Y) and archaeal histone [Nesidiocoris tenuis]|uniref:Histone-like transcription factor (CBF/NF-Y) and archaeal histone n=1 Tax=Nesidiocoris tenuis TaxID=355587 RepID=A0ABN7BFB7_9HEMI|nr:Histone-like transcription factor (CBF/NF-Y) and archaeal histone [Nesidiocoris tenuis]